MISYEHLTEGGLFYPTTFLIKKKKKKMAKDKIQMPSSTAGITRYFDDYKSKITFKPGHIIILTILVIVIITILSMYGNTWLGIP